MGPQRGALVHYLFSIVHRGFAVLAPCYPILLEVVDSVPQSVGVFSERWLRIWR